MCAVRRPRGTLQATNDANYEKKLQEAMEGYRDGTYSSIRAAAKDKGREEAEKQAQKKADDEAREARIAEEITKKIFDGGLSSYTRKDALIVLSGALGLSKEGTCEELKNKLKQHLQDHKDELVKNPRFTGLFNARRRKTQTAITPDRTNQAPQQDANTSPPLPRGPIAPVPPNPTDVSMRENDGGSMATLYPNHPQHQPYPNYFYPTSSFYPANASNYTTYNAWQISSNYPTAGSEPQSLFTPPNLYSNSSAHLANNSYHPPV